MKTNTTITHTYTQNKTGSSVPGRADIPNVIVLYSYFYLTLIQEEYAVVILQLFIVWVGNV